MFRKVAIPLVLLTAAAAGPIALFAGPDWWEALSNGTDSTGKTVVLPGKGVEDYFNNVDDSPAESPKRDPGGKIDVTSLAGAPVKSLAEVFNFDVTTDWILQRWPRVSTGLARLQLQGYRVPLVTGTKQSDLAGSLTYYFNSQQKVQQITFSGKTGDARELVKLLTTQHKFTRRVVNDPGLFIYETAGSGGQLRGVLKLRSARIVKATNPHGRYKVEFMMERPS